MSAPSRLGRLARIGGLTGRVGSSMLGDKLKDLVRGREDGHRAKARSQLESARQIAEVLGQLRGAAMKVGQGLALAAQHLDLPEEVQKVLETLHDDGEPVPFDRIQATIERELERPLTEAFAWIDPAPLGTASLAQAHAARLHDGTEVVIKVLHEGVDESIETDLLALKAIMRSGVVVGRDRKEIDAVLEEVEARLREELDYLQEAVNLQQFHDLWGSDPRVRIPRHHPSHSTERVLTMDRIPGRPLRAFLEDATPEARERAALTLVHMFFEMSFHRRILHADPHPGNYLFTDDGTVGFIDFGCVKRFDEFFIGTYARAVLSALNGDKDATLQAARDMGAWTGNDPAAGDTIWHFCDLLVAPWRAGAYRIGGPHDNLTERVQPAVKKMWRFREIRGPQHVLFLHRTLAGLYTMVGQLNVEAAWGDVIRAHCERAIAVAEGRA